MPKRRATQTAQKRAQPARCLAVDALNSLQQVEGSPDPLPVLSAAKRRAGVLVSGLAGELEIPQGLRVVGLLMEGEGTQMVGGS